jgi:hypothetical protein
MREFMVKLIGCLLTLFTIAANAASAIQPFEPDSMARIVASQKGKPFVLIVWSLDCVYCQASFATLVQEKRKRKNLNIVTLATDSLTDSPSLARMRNKLKTGGMVSNAWAFGSAPPEQLRYAIDPKWHGELPRSYWFNVRGEKVAYSGVITPAIIEKLSPH